MSDFFDFITDEHFKFYHWTAGLGAAVSFTGLFLLICVFRFIYPSSFDANAFTYVVWGMIAFLLFDILTSIFLFVLFCVDYRQHNLYLIKENSEMSNRLCKQSIPSDYDKLKSFYNTCVVKTDYDKLKSFYDRSVNSPKSLHLSGLRLLYSIKKRLPMFICKHCHKTIIVKNINFSCPYCDVEFVITDNQTQKQKGDVKIKGYRDLVDESAMEDVLFNECPQCHRIIQYIHCYHCKNDINIFEEYNETALKDKCYD